ncbi:MAG: hypothetical protein DRR08_06680 [Candidatus Parabeggiatoa sp. nov. 2]|nr:MAG: hypothetical protein B6247_00045 [Beggiatoa sp. 4572_84]RKZ62201.1 MAG: hypothetical protein DRR08_06680 [Gammaproteobacteria bacterium]HEC84361.1 hypothetical protein [Thioploca sp.]
MKFSKLRFAAVGILLGTSGLVVSCGGGDAVTRDSEPPVTRQSPHDEADCILPELGGSGNEGSAPSQPTRPRQNSGSGNAQALHDEADCILPELK